MDGIGIRMRVTYYTLRHLTHDQMRIYADAKGTPDAEILISEIMRKDLQGFELHRVCRRLICLRYAAMSGLSRAA